MEKGIEMIRRAYARFFAYARSICFLSNIVVPSKNMRYIEEFKTFALKGNVMDLAIGVVIGGAFGAIVTSLVQDVITPVIGMLTGGIDFSHLSFTLLGDAKITYGKFLQAAFSFLIVAWALFVVVKVTNKLKKKEEEKPPAVTEKVVTEDIKLLTEIRDLLKKG